MAAVATEGVSSVGRRGRGLSHGSRRQPFAPLGWCPASFGWVVLSSTTQKGQTLHQRPPQSIGRPRLARRVPLATSWSWPPAPAAEESMEKTCRASMARTAVVCKAYQCKLTLCTVVVLSKRSTPHESWQLLCWESLPGMSSCIASAAAHHPPRPVSEPPNHRSSIVRFWRQLSSKNPPHRPQTRNMLRTLYHAPTLWLRQKVSPLLPGSNNTLARLQYENIPIETAGNVPVPSQGAVGVSALSHRVPAHAAVSSKHLLPAATHSMPLSGQTPQQSSHPNQHQPTHLPQPQISSTHKLQVQHVLMQGGSSQEPSPIALQESTTFEAASPKLALPPWPAFGVDPSEAHIPPQTMFLFSKFPVCGMSFMQKAAPFLPDHVALSSNCSLKQNDQQQHLINATASAQPTC